jgi:hypothetical protein
MMLLGKYLALFKIQFTVSSPGIDVTKLILAESVSDIFSRNLDRVPPKATTINFIE